MMELARIKSSFSRYDMIIRFMTWTNICVVALDLCSSFLYGVLSLQSCTACCLPPSHSCSYAQEKNVSLGHCSLRRSLLYRHYGSSILCLYPGHSVLVSHYLHGMACDLLTSLGHWNLTTNARIML